jgi:chromosome segregation ATPase
MPDASFEGGAVQSELERLLSATLAALTMRDQRLAQPTDELPEYVDRLLVQTSLVEQKDAELVEMRAKLDELLLSRRSRDQQVHALEQALQKATSRAADAEERNRRACEQNRKDETELAAVRLRLADAENGWAKSKREADTLRACALTTASFVSTNEDRITRGPGSVRRIRAMDAETEWSDKNSVLTQYRNEG